MPDKRDDYDWLYAPDGDGAEESGRTTGSRGRSRARSQGLSQAQHAPSEAGQQRHEPVPSTLPDPVLPPPSGKKKTKARRKRPVLKFFAFLLVLWLGFLLAVSAVAWSKIERVDARSRADRPGDQPGTTFVLVGTDKRPEDTSRGRTDTILLLHHGAGPTVLTSIPRDSLVDIPGHGRTKINAAYSYGGAPLLVETIERSTGIRIDGYVELGFTGLVEVVDGLGGIEICPDRRLVDRDSKLDIEAGCQQVDGDTALAYSRNRKALATGDIGRGAAQREVIGAIGAEVRSPMTFLDPRRYAQVALSSADAIVLGDDVNPIDFLRFGWALSGAMSGSGLNCTVPIRDYAVNWDGERAAAFFDKIATGQAASLGDLCTSTGRPR